MIKVRKLTKNLYKIIFYSTNKGNNSILCLLYEIDKKGQLHYERSRP